jgi:hypothetical protein
MVAACHPARTASVISYKCTIDSFAEARTRGGVRSVDPASTERLRTILKTV